MEIGQIVKASELGFQGTDKYIYHRCIDCGKLYWVRFKVKEGTPSHVRCKRCTGELYATTMLKKRQAECKGTPEEPVFGDIRRSTEIKKSGKRLYYIYVPCPNCGKGRWIDLGGHKHEVKTRRCYSCAARLSSGRITRLKGDKSPAWKGGRTVTRDGRVLIHEPSNPRANKRGYVYEHVKVWQEYHSKELPKGWEVHHLNGVVNDNRPENLVALPTRQHKLILRELRRRIRELESRVRASNQQGRLV